MVRERDTNYTVGPNRTKADIHRTGYIEPNPHIGIANSELPQVRELPVRRARSEVLYQQDLEGEALSEVIRAFSPFKTSL